jgi:hypothetical protein
MGCSFFLFTDAKLRGMVGREWRKDGCKEAE